MVDALPQPGQIVAGKYRLTKVLGEGGMGIVYEAEHVRLGQRVALKMLLPEFLRVEDLVKRFEREARAASQLRSRHTARVVDVDLTPEGLPYMVMELLEGRDLDAELEARKSLPLEEAVDYVLQVCGAMDEAHAFGIVHRDLKPSNIFLAQERGIRVAKILDFGISKVASDGDSKLTSADAVMGTAMYMAPEQVRASRSVDSRADIWSIGVILYELLCGRAPFVGTPTQVAAAIVTEDPPPIAGLVAVPAGISLALTKCLARNPNDRFPSVRELMQALLPFTPASSQGAITVHQVLGDSAATTRSSAAFAVTELASSSLPREEAKTSVGWTQGGSNGRGRTTMVGVMSVIVALGLLGFIGSRIFAQPNKTPAASSAWAPESKPPPVPEKGPSTAAVVQTAAHPVPPSVPSVETVPVPSAKHGTSPPKAPPGVPPKPSAPPVAPVVVPPRPPAGTPPPPPPDPNHL